MTDHRRADASTIDERMYYYSNTNKGLNALCGFVLCIRVPPLEKHKIFNHLSLLSQAARETDTVDHPQSYIVAAVCLDVKTWVSLLGKWIMSGIGQSEKRLV